MDKTISTKLPEEEVETLEKMAGEKGESVSGFVRNLVRMAIEKNGKVNQNPDKNPDPETAKKIEGVAKLLSGIPSILDAKTQKILDEIGKIPKSEGGGRGVGIDQETSKKILDSLTENVRKLDDLKVQIDAGGSSGRSAGGERVSFKNPEFWKKAMAIVGIWSLIFAGLTGWGMWKIYDWGTLNAETTGMAMASPVYESFNILMNCDVAGWKWKWDKDKKQAYCNLGPNPLNRKPYSLRIR